MILRLECTEDDISVKERNRILEEITKEKGRYINYAALKEDCARKRGYSSWAEYQKVLIKRHKERKQNRGKSRLYVLFTRAKKVHPEKLEKYIACGRF